MNIFNDFKMSFYSTNSIFYFKDVPYLYNVALNKLCFVDYMYLTRIVKKQKRSNMIDFIRGKIKSI